MLGFNYRLSEVQVATLLAGLETLEGSWPPATPMGST